MRFESKLTFPAGAMSFAIRMFALAVFALPLSACAPPPPPPAVYVAPAAPRPWVYRLAGWPPCPPGYHLGAGGGRCWLNVQPAVPMTPVPVEPAPGAPPPGAPPPGPPPQ